MIIHYDDIVIGAGLIGISVIIGLPKNRKILLCEGDDVVGLKNYPNTAMPYGNYSSGGLANFWHGVIPFSDQVGLVKDRDAFTDLLRYFYPNVPVNSLPEDKLFIPWRPIRPRKILARLKKERSGLYISKKNAEKIKIFDDSCSIEIDGNRISAKRIWVAAGAISSPYLIEYLSKKKTKTKRKISDHVIGYVGQLRTSAEISVEMCKIRRHRHGVIIPSFFNEAKDILYTIKPARFDFAKLDNGFRKRAVFGIPLSKGLASIMGKVSLGLIAEALFNKLGIAPFAKLYNVYYQAAIPKLYEIDLETGLHGPNNIAKIRNLGLRAQKELPFNNLIPSSYPDRYLPGIHLHDSMSSDEINTIQLAHNLFAVDAACVSCIGPEHHSFRIMANAYSQAQKQI